jgi:hypothetical protein
MVRRIIPIVIITAVPTEQTITQLVMIISIVRMVQQIIHHVTTIFVRTERAITLHVTTITVAMVRRITQPVTTILVVMVLRIIQPVTTILVVMVLRIIQSVIINQKKDVRTQLHKILTQRQKKMMGAVPVPMVSL